MFDLGFSEIKKAVKLCFDRGGTWYERSILFSMFIFVIMISCLLPFGFFLPLIFLPYFLVIEKNILLLYSCREKISWKAIWPSARRYGRSFCIFVTKLLGGVFVLPLLTLVFTGYIQSECEELDFKGVILLSRELVRGSRFKVLLFALCLYCLFVVWFSLVSVVVLVLKNHLGLSRRAMVIVMLSAMLIALVFAILPLWGKFVESLYLKLKKDKIKEK